MPRSVMGFHGDDAFLNQVMYADEGVKIVYHEGVEANLYFIVDSAYFDVCSKHSATPYMPYIRMDGHFEDVALKFKGTDLVVSYASLVFGENGAKVADVKNAPVPSSLFYLFNEREQIARLVECGFGRPDFAEVAGIPPILVGNNLEIPARANVVEVIPTQAKDVTDSLLFVTVEGAPTFVTDKSHSGYSLEDYYRDDLLPNLDLPVDALLFSSANTPIFSAPEAQKGSRIHELLAQMPIVELDENTIEIQDPSPEESVEVVDELVSDGLAAVREAMAEQERESAERRSERVMPEEIASVTRTEEPVVEVEPERPSQPLDMFSDFDASTSIEEEDLDIDVLDDDDFNELADLDTFDTDVDDDFDVIDDTADADDVAVFDAETLYEEKRRREQMKLQREAAKRAVDVLFDEEEESAPEQESIREAEEEEDLQRWTREKGVENQAMATIAADPDTYANPEEYASIAGQLPDNLQGLDDVQVAGLAGALGASGAVVASAVEDAIGDVPSDEMEKAVSEALGSAAANESLKQQVFSAIRSLGDLNVRNDEPSEEDGLDY